MRPLGPPPHKRPNWHRLNEGQKRYAYEQYMLARVRRGLPIDHDIPSVTEIDESQPAHIRNNTFTTTADIHEPPIAERERPDELLPEPTLPQQESNQSTQHIQSIVDDAIESILNINRSNREQQPESNISLRQLAERMDGSAMEISSSSNAGTKRAHSGGASGVPAKKSSTSGTHLPGTAAGQGGPENAGDTGTSRVGPIEKPISMQYNDHRFFRKVHRFLTFGLAYRPIAQVNTVVTGATWSDVFMITPMAHIPWDRAFMYLNPSEFKNLPPGSKVKHMSCEIAQRNVRVAFPTNSTADNLATLNQNKDALYAIGLSEKVQGINVIPKTFQDKQPMICSSIEDPGSFKTPADWSAVFNDWVTTFYGVPNSDTNFATNTPFHQFGIPFACELYYAPVTQKEDTFNSGWANFQSHVQEFNADVTSGTNLVHVEYTPREGLLKPPLGALYNGFPYNPLAGKSTEIYTPDGFGNQNPTENRMTVGQNDTVPGNVQLLNKSQSFAYGVPSYTEATYKITDLIEKDSVIRQGFPAVHIPKVCPSLHVGVKPVPALTTNVIGNNANGTFTDVQCLWECVCEMAVEVPHGTERPLAEFENLSYADMYSSTGRLILPQYTMVHGQYQSASPVINK